MQTNPPGTQEQCPCSFPHPPHDACPGISFSTLVRTVPHETERVGDDKEVCDTCDGLGLVKRQPLPDRVPAIPESFPSSAFYARTEEPEKRDGASEETSVSKIIRDYGFQCWIDGKHGNIGRLDNGEPYLILANHIASLESAKREAEEFNRLNDVRVRGICRKHLNDETVDGATIVELCEILSNHIELGEKEMQRLEAERDEAREKLKEAERWKGAVIEKLIVSGVLNGENGTDPHKALHDWMCWETAIALDPRVSDAAQKLIEPYKLREQRGGEGETNG